MRFPGGGRLLGHRSSCPQGRTVGRHVMGRAPADVLASILPYVPPYVVQELASDPNATCLGGRVAEGTLLLADVAGFTPMSESLARTGKEGAEELTLLITACFTRIVSIITSYGGIPLKFGGDSVLALFLGRAHAQRGVRCALVAQHATRSFRRVSTSVGHFPLRMSIGVNTGKFLEAVVGPPSERLHHLIVGPAVNEAARLEAMASAGDVLVGPATLAALGSADVARVSRRAFRVIRFGSRVRRVSSASTAAGSVTDIAALTEALRPYVPRQVLERAKAGASPLMMQGEHRLATVMFVNFRRVGGRSIFSGRQVAAAVRLLDSYLTTVQRVVTRLGGELLANDVGRGEYKLLVAFGALVAHEDDEERAAQAALQLRSAVSQLGLNIDQRIGISSGHVFAGDVGSATRKDFTVMGDAVNLAARLAAAAKWGQVILADRTHSKIADRFDFETLPPIAIKGKAARVSAHILTGHRKGEASPRFLPDRARSPLLAREEEILALKRLMSQVLSGNGQVMEISGAPGIGKSRLVEELRRLWAEGDREASVGQCLSFGMETAFLPWSSLLRSLLGVQPEQSKRVREDNVRQAASRLGSDLREVAGVLGDALGFPLDETAVAKSLDPQRRLQRLMDVVTHVIRTRAQEQPLLLVIEDMHWADAVSRELLDHVAAHIEDVPVFLCLTQRSTERLPLAVEQMPHYTRLLLKELPPEASVELARLAIGVEALPDELGSLIVLKSRGNPFYIEQMMKSLANAGRVRRDERTGQTVVGEVLTIEVPDSVEGMVMSRLDSLDEASRTVLQVASVVGPRFQRPIVERILPQPTMAEGVEPSLERIEQAGLIRIEGSVPTAQYAFEHGLVQQTVYESLPFANRRELHRRVGEYLEEHYPDVLDDYLELLSFHYSNSTDKTRALLYATKAAEKCARMFANREAVEHYRRAQGVLETLSAGAIAEQGKVYAGLGDVYVLTGRYDEAIATCRSGFDRQRWCSRGRPSEEAQAHARCAGLLCHTMGVAHERKGQYQRAMQWYRRGLVTLGEQHFPLQATIHLAMAGVFHRQGRYAEALEECTRGVDLARSSGNLAELAHGYYLLGNIHTDTGQVEKAIEYRQQGLNIYRQTGDLTGQAKALNNLGVDYYYLGDWPASARSYRESLALCERAGDVTEAAVIANNLGEILSDQGDLEDACQLFSKSLGTWQAMGYKLGVALACSNLGRAATRKGHYTEAVELLQRSITMFREIGSKAFLAEAHARLAEACLELGECHGAAGHARRSLALALRANAPLAEAFSRRVLGEVQLRQRRWAAAERSLLESRLVDERVGACYELGQTLYDLAVLYRQSPPSLLPDGRAKEREALTLARSIFRRLGARRDLEKATHLARSAKLDRAIR